jgi:hypothetical protein
MASHQVWLKLALAARTDLGLPDALALLKRVASETKGGGMSLGQQAGEVQLRSAAAPTSQVGLAARLARSKPRPTQTAHDR